MINSFTIAVYKSSFFLLNLIPVFSTSFSLDKSFALMIASTPSPPTLKTRSTFAIAAATNTSGDADGVQSIISFTPAMRAGIAGQIFHKDLKESPSPNLSRQRKGEEVFGYRCSSVVSGSL